MLKNFQQLGILTACMLALLLSACAVPAQNPTPPSSQSIGVAGFTQPKTTADMLAGYMPENVKPINPEIFPQLDTLFMTELGQNTQRSYVSAKLAKDCQNGRQVKENALSYWAEVGRCMGVDLLVVPQLVFWQERDGGSAGVERPAGVTADFFLIDVKQISLISRSRYDEVQKDLSANLMNTGKFFQRGGKWVTAYELAQEAMRKAIKDFRL